ncbi:Xanthine/uracil/vitamin C permease [Metarhizium album ARSEF 1941]|uniref:Xanthine/uracil/vitamin C permease n=1 Tax=Metarhizium album (strain ARSEF 1941) TaxID=1081103 RepID=A0A0B2X3L5_METAS|nr:Xanthine/uracil/vitamin C permease [Metarhizium album ARSEF 1941]KHO00939.1 Xanthine/uracil/vitamin C permease [Metarhizium album ARSEF 1941]
MELRKFFRSIDLWVANSRFGSYFRLGDSDNPDKIDGASFCREIRAGLTTFATMAYIISVNVRRVPPYVRRELITATAAIAGLSSLVFGIVTNLPVALAPGMGLNAYFAFQVVGVNGDGKIPYQTALTAVFIEGIIFVVLALSGMRQWLVKLIPSTLKVATGVGIGFLLTEIGLSYSVGIGAITGGGRATPLALGGCPPELLSATTGMCESGQMTNPKLWLGVFCGGIVTAFLMAYRIKYSLVIGIALVSVISWPRNTPVTYFPDTDEGNSRFDFFKQIVAWHPMSKTLNQLDWTFSSGSSQFALALFTFLYVDIIDATATLYSMVRFCGVDDRKDGDFRRSTLAYCTDALFISIGALFGLSPVTAFIESGAGIAEGGRTGITAIVSGLCFLTSIFFAPVFASLPPWATGCTLIMITQVNWYYIGDVLPSFIVMTFIPFSYSVAYGLIAGIFVYTILNGLVGIIVHVSGGRIEPREYDLKEYWTWKGIGRPPWFVRVMKRHRRCRDEGGNTITSGSNGTDDMDGSSSMTRVKTISNDYSAANGGAKM